MNDMIKNILLWVIIAAVLVMVFSNIGPKDTVATTQKLPYSDFINKVKHGQIKSVEITNQNIHGLTASETKFSTYLPWKDPFITDTLLKHDVLINAKPPAERGMLMTILISWFPFILLIVIWIFLMRQMSGGKGGGAFSFGKSKARLLGEDQIKTTLADVAGVEEAKEEVGEIIDFLRDPTKYHNLGGQIPHGVLMVGPPGTGKTLLARAIAGEAKVPFFSISGSDFVEMFVGVGASRVRDMFEQAKKRSPCIIFIDEIDAVGRHRGAGMGGGHDEREQTLNQLLVEMDGFDQAGGVIVIAATNRPDVLDPALLRPGRFDRQVTVALPDVRGREQILEVHMRKVPLGNDVKPDWLARGTPGFSGADLANLVNEAALFAARLDKTKVSMDEFEKAKDKILMGTERRSMIMSEHDKKLTAYHESGHAIVGRLMPEHDPVYKVSIIPRGRALGVTMFLPEKDRVSYTKQHLLSQLCSLFGGRLAETIIFGENSVTTGASNDIERATEIARKMVTQWGLSDTLGPLNYGKEGDEPFLGHSMGMQRGTDISDETAAKIDKEVRRIIDQCYAEAEKTLQGNMDILHAMTDALMEYETIDSTQIDNLMARKAPGVPESWANEKPKKPGSRKTGGKTTKTQRAEKTTKPNLNKPLNGDV